MRRRRPEKREILPDPVYSNLMVAKFVNYIMNDGKKGVAEKIFYGAMDQVKSKTKTEGIKIITKPTLFYIYSYVGIFHDFFLNMYQHLFALNLLHQKYKSTSYFSLLY